MSEPALKVDCSRAVPIEVIEPLCAPFARQADRVLDLYEMSKSPLRHPGRCLRCFYELFQAAPPRNREALSPLRQWIEENMVIAYGPDRTERAGVMPMELDEPDLESFCFEAMRKARQLGPRLARQLELEIQFKPIAA